MVVKDDSIIGDVLARHPKAAAIMEAYGLHCTSCSVNTIEPIKAGAMAHGMPEDVANKMIAELNELMANKAPIDGIHLTERAAQKVQEFAKAEDKEGWGLKVTAKPQDGKEPAYLMDFQEKAEDEKTFEFHGVQLFIDADSFKLLKGSDIDFLDTPFGSGFKIENPNFKKGGCCGGGGCGNGGCGSGSCGCS